MYKRENTGYSQPPLLKSPPPMPSPMDSNRSYRWTSMTAANNSNFSTPKAATNSNFITPLKETPKRPDTSWWSPSRGDTWRRNAPRGRTLDLVAAFDQCARQENHNRQSRLSADIPEEPMFDKIDGKLDFVEVATGDSDEKSTLEHTIDGYTKIRSKKQISNQLDLSANTYQELDIEKDTTPHVQQFESDATGSSVSSTEPQFTRSRDSWRRNAPRGRTQDLVAAFDQCSRQDHIVRQSLPFSDIPEERTCDKIDEMFDFVEVPTGDFDEKSILERTIDIDGISEIRSEGTPKKQMVNTLDIAENAFQELEIEEDTTPYVQQIEGDGSGFTASSSGPQFTRSPTLVTPHAGQSVAEYRVSEKEGCAKTEKIVVQRMLQPAALATSTPKGTFAYRSRNQSSPPEDSFVSSISNFSAADKLNDSRRQISKLIETIEKTRKHIQLAEISLIDAKKARMVVQELASQRVLLICRERLKLQLDEIRRLQALSVVRHPPPPINRHFKSAMVISNIAINLNKNFNSRGSFAFIVALKCRTEIEATGVVTLLAHYQTRLHQIHFGEHMHFSNLPVDFVISMEVYMMRVPEYKVPEKTCASVLASKVRSVLVPNSAHRRAKATNMSSASANRTVYSLPGYQAPECEFKFCGKLTLDRDSAGDRQFYLDDVTYPLEGTVKLVSHCSSLPEAIDVEYRGFLYLFDERSPNGDAAWEKYWAMLHRGVIFFWKNPIDEKNEKVPLSQIDLTKCTNQSIEETRNERAHEFHIELLIDQTPSLLEKRRVVLAAESSDHLSSWLDAINDTLYVLRS